MQFREYVQHCIKESERKVEDYQEEIQKLEKYRCALPEAESQKKKKLELFIECREAHLIRLKEIVEKRLIEERQVLTLVESLGQREQLAQKS